MVAFMKKNETIVCKTIFPAKDSFQNDRFQKWDENYYYGMKTIGSKTIVWK